MNECVLCDRPGLPTSYFPPPDYDVEVEIALCQYHKGSYMAHGIKALDKLWKEGKVPEWKWEAS